MNNLLIVDDEKNIRLGIQAMIQRGFPNQFKIFIANNGVEALKILNTEQIDILLTDIKMPEMDGIQLVYESQSLENIPAIVIISGYDDFDYAKEAIKYRVKDYLLKPINRNELYQTIESVQNELQSDQKLLDEFDEYCANQLNYIFIHPRINEEEIEKLLLNLKLEEFSDGFYIGIMKLFPSSDENLSYVKEILAKNCYEASAGSFSFNDQNGNIVLLTKNISIFDCMINHMDTDHLSIGIGNQHADLRKIKQAYEEATIALKNHFLFSGKPLIKYGDITDEITSMDTELPFEELQKISNMIGTNRDEEIKMSLLNILNVEAISRKGIRYMEQLNKSINTIILDAAYSRLGEESIEIIKPFKRIGDMYHFESFYDYYFALEELIFLLHEYNKQLKSVYSGKKHMEMAIEYIHENYHKDINLAVVSNHVSLNYSYFSHMFKEFTGDSFVDYLKKVRVEKAKAFLSSPDYRIFEVSILVGYKNPKQFTRVFREIEGISPSEYQEKIL